MIFEQKVEMVVMLAQSKENEGRYIRYHEKNLYFVLGGSIASGANLMSLFSSLI